MSDTEGLDDFLDAVNKDTEMSTEYKVCPELAVADASVDSYQIDSGTIENGDRAGDIWRSLTLKWNIDNEEAREEMKRDTVIVYGERIFLNFNEGGVLDPEKNQPLAVVVKAFGIDSKGMTNRELFDSMVGQYAKVAVTHELYDEKVMAKVSKVAAG